MKVKITHTNLIVVLLIIISVSAGAYIFSNYQEPDEVSQPTTTTNFGPIHWHPKVSITINGEKQFIPVNIGITVGKIMDTEVAGMRMSPMHTHETDGTIHMEQQNPKEHTMKLGYFFDVWDKKFDSECIFEYCNSDEKTLKMFVNGEPNYEFDNYMLKDKDNIEIIYE